MAAEAVGKIVAPVPGVDFMLCVRMYVSWRPLGGFFVLLYDVKLFTLLIKGCNFATSLKFFCMELTTLF